MRQILVFLVALTAGCQKEYVWEHPMKTVDAFYMDSGDCDARAISGMPDPGYDQYSLMAAAAARDGIYRGCMQSKGWRLVEQKK